MKEFIKILRRFVPPYKKYMVLTIVFNLLSAFMNIFSFMAIVPILNILFKTDETVQKLSFMPWHMDHIKDIAMNNMNYGVQQLIAYVGPTTTLLIVGLFLIVMTFIKTMCYFISSAVTIPLRTGIVRDLRNHLYNRSEERRVGKECRL